MPVPHYVPYLSTLSDAQLFKVVNVVLPAWLCISIAPRSNASKFFVSLATLAITVVYVLGLLTLMPQFGGFMGMMEQFFSYEGVVRVFNTPGAALVGWIHYGVTDLISGWWIALDGQNRRINKLVVIVCLFFTMMFGPVGVLMYLVARKLLGQEPNSKAGSKGSSKRK